MNAPPTSETHALVSWIRSFPQLKDVPCKDEDEFYYQDWLNDEQVASAILLAAEEICQSVSIAETTASSAPRNKSHYRSSCPSSSSSHHYPFISSSNNENINNNQEVSYYAESTSTIWKHIYALAKMRYREEEYVPILSTLLRISVSDQCRFRETYSFRLLELENDNVRDTLMEIIEGGGAAQDGNGGRRKQQRYGGSSSMYEMKRLVERYRERCRIFECESREMKEEIKKGLEREKFLELKVKGLESVIKRLEEERKELARGKTLRGN